MPSSGIIRVGEKKAVYQLLLMNNDQIQLLAYIQTKQRQLKLLMLGALEGMDLDPIKVRVLGWDSRALPPVHSPFFLLARCPTASLAR